MAATAEWVDQSIDNHEVSNRKADSEHRGRKRKRESVDAGSWSLRTKLLLTLALMWVAMIAIVLSMALQERGDMFAERKLALTNIVSLVETRLEGYAVAVRAGEMSQAEAQSRAVEAIAAMRFGAERKNYIFVVDDEQRIVYHPRREADTDMSDYTDPARAPIYRQFVDMGVSQGTGFVGSVSQRTADSPFLDKLSYVERFMPWQWNIVAGVYTDDVQTAFYHHLQKYALVLLIIGGLLTLAFWLVVRSVYRTLGGEPRDAQTVVERIAAGDLSASAQTGCASHGLLASIERMRMQLALTVTSIRECSESIDVGAREIASGNNDLSARTEEQAASLEQTAASMEQMTATVRQNADNAGQASQLSNDTTASANRGEEIVGRVVATMREIDQSSSEISEIITMIDGIAFQTNLLALNAAVEAARAGEHGRGFAVVASEVRQLAQRSADAAQSIKSLIERSVSQVASGAVLVGEAEQAMGDIQGSADRVSRLMDDISGGTREQTSGIDQINEAVAQIDQVTQQNAALVEEAAAAAVSLEQRAAELSRAVAGFRVDSDAA
ncbi:methyl-accepting chemotaxis sensory transducer [Salinisphaera shabanensis T35B1]|uniref:methyl-accepting chemotaxis protein n=1 Tax=Salinisphaera shabanensis TaxID=180542 RepID=UPI00333F32D1